jgi:hypothetical protein
MKVTPENYFEASQALHWYCLDWHDTLNSELYRIQCILGYKPAPSEMGCSADEIAEEFYTALTFNEVSPATLLEDIQKVIKTLDD